MTKNIHSFVKAFLILLNIKRNVQNIDCNNANCQNLFTISLHTHNHFFYFKIYEKLFDRAIIQAYDLHLQLFW